MRENDATMRENLTFATMRVAHGATYRKCVGSIVPVAATCSFYFPTKKEST